MGGSLFAATAASGRPQPASGAQLRQGHLEASTASPIELLRGQRTLQFLAKVIQVQEEMAATANQLRP